MENKEVNSLITSDLVNKILKDKVARIAIVSQSHYWFFHLYFHEYVQFPTANFQKEMFSITENEAINMAIIVAFRESAKSTIMTMSYPLWAILGRMKKKCVVIISQTQQQVKTHFANLKRELENNVLLKSDLGPFQEESDEWGSFSLVIPRYGAKIIAFSSEQGIRGLRHGAYRPDVIICDDVEDINTVKTKEGRDKAFQWFTSEVVPLGSLDTKMIVVGNLLHEDSLLMRLKKGILENNIDGIIREYPIIKDGNPLWPEKFSSPEIIEKYKRKIGNEQAWQREYMLKIIADGDQVIKPDWIQFYDEIPPKDDSHDYEFTLMGIDLAISERETADYTAIVCAHIFGHEDTLRVYIDRWILNERIDFPTALEKTKEMARALMVAYDWESKIYVEDVAYQKAFAQTLKNDNYNVEGVNIGRQDKRSRLNLVSYLIKSGKVLFPKTGAKNLIEQIVYFGVEKHDDLCDALTLLLTKVIEKDRQQRVELYKNEFGIY